ncbi:MAG: RNA polymerase-binding transcription factor DksA [bacterium]|nr:MAG: RNA polymerase-binding transcription factor DksA [bacterium]
MKKEQVGILKEKLDKIRVELLGGVDNVVKHSNDAFESEAPDINDEASRTYNRQVMLSLGEVERQILKLVDEAMQAIKNGEYGTCIDCEGEIPYKRLDAVPYAKRCIECREKWEEGIKASK